MPFLGNRKSIRDRKEDPPEEAVDAPGLETWAPDKGMARGRSRVSALADLAKCLSVRKAYSKFTR